MFKGACTGVAVIAGVVGLAAIEAEGVTITTAMGNGADAYVSNDSHQSGNTSHGAATSLSIRRYDGTRQKFAYFRFDLSSVGPGPISNAVLSFDLSSANRARTFSVYGIIDDDTNDNWIEIGAGALSYNSLVGLLAPAEPNNAEAPQIDPAEAVYLGDIAMIGAAPQWLSSNNGEAGTTLATNGALDAFLNQDTNGLVTFMVMVSASDANATYGVTSKEADPALAPTLTFDVAVPEPASLGLLSVGALGLLRRRR